jgi:hypothetical protein
MAGFANHLGNTLCYKTVTGNTLKIFYWLQIRLFGDNYPILHVDPPDGKTSDASPVQPMIQSVTDHHTNMVQVDNTTASAQEPGSTADASIFDLEVLIGQMILLDSKYNSAVSRARLHDNPTQIKLQCAIGDNGEEEMITYAKLLNYLQCDTDNPPAY